MSKNKIENRIAKREKTIIKIEIDLIYDLKLKSNVIGIKIRTKTWFLTQDRLELIQFLAESKAFYSANSKPIVGIQESISPYSLNEISLSNTSRKRKWV